MQPSPRSDEVHRKPLAIICDIDDTILVGFDNPIVAAVSVLKKIDRMQLSVHYVTARPEASRPGTEEFIGEHRLPGWKNLHFCPSWKSSKQHKIDAHEKIKREYEVIVAIGDHDEDAHAALTTGIRFIRVLTDNSALAWAEMAEVLRFAMVAS